MATPSQANVKLKLLIDTKGHKVLFAEAGKDFVDFLFSLLQLPVGTVISLLTKDGMVGSLGCLYQSIKELSYTYIQSSQNKDVVLNPEARICAGVREPPLDEGGFVKGVVTYMLMDNLEVKPVSTISSITLLNKFNVQHVGSLEERVVELDMDLALDLLETSLQCKTVLTTLFLGETGD